MNDSFRPEGVISVGESFPIRLDRKSFIATRVDDGRYPWELRRPPSQYERWHGSTGLIGTYATFDRMVHSLSEQVVGGIHSLAIHLVPTMIFLCHLQADGSCIFTRPHEASVSK